MAAAGFIVGCTAIIDGAGDWHADDMAAAPGSHSESGGASLDAGGRSSVMAPSLGGDESAGGEVTAPAGGSGSGSQGGEAGCPASDAGRASGGAGEPAGQGGVSGADGSVGQNTEAGGAAAAGESSVGGSPAAGGSDGAPPSVIGDPAKGHQILILDNCYRCHGDNLAGRGFYPNITPDIETGIGGWTDKQISTAVRGAIGPDGELFCAVMPLYSGFTPQEVADLIAFLRIVPAVENSIVAVCPGHNP